MPYLGNVPAEAYSQVSYQDLTGGSGTSFTLDYPVGSAGEIEVFVNNVRQEPTVAYTVNGTALTMTGSVAATDDFYVVFQGKAEKSGTIPEKQTDGTYVFPDDVTVNGNITVDTNTLHVDSANNRVGIGTATPAAASLQIKKDTASTTNELLRLSNSAGSTTDGVKLVMEVANTSGNGGEIGTVRDGGSFNPYMYFSTSAGVGSSPVERLRITSDGSVGIGTDTPTGSGQILHINSSTTVSDLHMTNSTSGSTSTDGFILRYSGLNAEFLNREAGSNIFYTSGVERMRLEGDALTLTNTKTGVTSSAMVFSNAQSSGAYRIRFDANSATRGDIRVTTSSVAYNTTSDARLKENVVDLTGAIDRVNQIPVRRFNFIADPDTTVDGFLAHEVQTVVPEAITGTQDEVDENGNPVYQGIDQSKLVPLLTAALQEALTEIADLKTRVAALETP
jgi:uncharacterized glyoxalase superfamily protein PhnB